MKNTYLSLIALLFTLLSVQGIKAQCINTDSVLSMTICAQSPYLFRGTYLDSSGTYNDTLTTVIGGCDSIFTLVLTVLPTPTVDLYDTICQGGYVFMLGDTLRTSGTYSDTVYTVGTANTNQCDSFTHLHLTVLPASHDTTTETVNYCTPAGTGNAYNFYGTTETRNGTYYHTIPGAPSGGLCVDTTIKLILTFLRQTANTNISVTQCSGTYTFYGRVLDSSNVYYDTLTSRNGCDSLIVLTLSIGVIPAGDTVRGTACPGSDFVYGGNSYPAPVPGGGGPPATAVYYDTVTGSGGCDSFIVIEVTALRPIRPTNITASICTGSSYNFNGQILTTAGTYADTFTTTSNGCDSIVNLTLTLTSYYNVAVNGATCGGTTGYVFRGTTYPGPTGFMPAIYYDTVPSISSCDTIFTITVRRGMAIATVTDSVSICAGQTYSWAGNTYGSAGTYIDTFNSVGGCDSIIRLVLSIGSYDRPADITGTACSGQAFTWRGHSYLAPTQGFGPPPAPITYYDTIPAVSGCDTIFTIVVSIGNVNITVTDSFCAGSSYTYRGTVYTAPVSIVINTTNNPIACDTMIALTLTYKYTPKFNTVDSFCFGSTYYFHGDSFTRSGTDTVYKASPVTGACDSMFIVRLTYKTAPRYAISDSFCEGSTFTYRTYSFIDSGTHVVTLPTAGGGCDTIVALHLSYSSAPSYSVADSFCAGSLYIFRGDTFARAGVHIVTVSSPSGCDTVITLTLRYKAAPIGRFTASFCRGTSYVYDGTTFTTAGRDTLTEPAPGGGCDSIIILTLTYTTPPTATYSVSFCQGTSYTYDGHTYTTAGIDTISAPAPVGCDSVIVLNLSYSSAFRISVTDSFCQGSTYYYRGDSFTISGVDSITLTSGTCDTIVTLNLSYKAQGAALSIINPGNNVLYLSGTAVSYQWYLNGTLIPGDTNSYIDYTQSGNYTVVTYSAGSSCPQTSAAVNAIYNGISEISSDMFKLYPNPNSGKFTLETTEFSGTDITIYDVLGRAVYQKQLNTALEVIDMSTAPGGTYFMIMKNPQFTRFAHFVIAQ